MRCSDEVRRSPRADAVVPAPPTLSTLTPSQTHNQKKPKTKAARLAELLERAGLPPALLTPRARLLSAVAARVADALGAAAATPEHALACWAELAVRESRAAALKASADARAAEMRAEAAPVEARGAALAEALRSARDAAAGHGGGGGGRRRAELEARSVQEMAAKRSEYERVVARCERKIGAALAAAAAAAAAAADAQAEQQQQQREQQPQPTMLLRHAELQRRAERLAAKRGELREAERRAAEFLDLPASVAGARAALEQARERLARSQERLELGLAQL